MRLVLPALAALMLAGAPLLAGPNPQLVQIVQHKLPSYGFGGVDVAAFDTATVVALYLAMSQHEFRGQTQRRLKTILDNPSYRN